MRQKFVKQKLTSFHPSCFASLNTMCNFKGDQVVLNIWQNLHLAWDCIQQTSQWQSACFWNQRYDRRILFESLKKGLECFKWGPNMRLTLYIHRWESNVFSNSSLDNSNMSSLEAVADNYEKYWQSASSIQIKSSWAYWIHGPVRWIILFNSDSYWKMAHKHFVYILCLSFWP